MTTYLSMALLLFATVHLSISDKDYGLNSEDFDNIFGMQRDDVTRYEIVTIDLKERINKRSVRVVGNTMRITAFGKTIKVELNPVDDVLVGHNTPVYYATSTYGKPGKVDYSRVDGLFAVAGRMYENLEKQASVVIKKDEYGKNKINGLINSERIIVKSLDTDMANRVRKSDRLKSGTDNSDAAYHVVYQLRRPARNVTKKYSNLLTNEITRRPKPTKINSIVLYPEILVVVEYSLWKFFSNRIYNLLGYIMAFWNGVDLKYRSLKFPKFRFNIAGVIIALDAESTPYISRNMLFDGSFHSSRAWSSATYYYYRQRKTFPLDKYDVSVTHTMLNLARFDSEQNKLSTDTLGLASIGTVCERNDELNFTRGATVVYDDGGFGAVFTAAHELGHLFGALHDASERCPSTAGHLMEPIRYLTSNSSDFSECSIDGIKHHLKEGFLNCMYNRPQTEGPKLRRLMPGTISSLNEQCQAQGYGPSCKVQKGNVCINMRCQDDESRGCIDTHFAPADGTPCGRYGKICLHMECVRIRPKQPRPRTKPTVGPSVILVP